jgi:hypothetical protein
LRLLNGFRIQGDFEGCADIWTYDRTPQKVTIESIMPYVDIFREKGAQSFPKTITLDFDKNINLNVNLNHKCLSPTWRKSIWFLICGEARGHSKLARQIYGERLLQRIFPNGLTFVNFMQHLRAFGRFEMNKRDLARQREVAKEDIAPDIQERHFQE